MTISRAWAELVTRVGVIEDVRDAHGAPLAAAALQFPLGHPQVAAVIPSLASPAKMLQTEALMSFAVAAAFWDDLKQRGLLRRDAPTPL